MIQVMSNKIATHMITLHTHTHTHVDVLDNSRKNQGAIVSKIYI